ncbi:hypothetical protein ACIQMP_21470 [Streptomyces sp. NPDC091385]|uniref:hypothetical protein n=1 Tax=Streptomyces sp. NPDC091385 TaxID=3365997 RepID=UPI00381B202B
MSNFNTIWPVASFVLGAALTQFNAHLTEKRQRVRDVESRRHEYSKLFLEGKRSFEIEVLTDLHRSLTTLSNAADELSKWHRISDDERDVDVALELCLRIQVETAAAWRLDGLLFDHELSRQVGNSIGIELFPNGPKVIPGEEHLDEYADSVWEAHAEVAKKLKKVYELTQGGL